MGKRKRKRKEMNYFLKKRIVIQNSVPNEMIENGGVVKKTRTVRMGGLVTETQSGQARRSVWRCVWGKCSIRGSACRYKGSKHWPS